jgi:hypothetical protein|tara:strand:- start:108 stop:212 length:105 start_codon:yes stop_codon:yes gene_type:complete
MIFHIKRIAVAGAILAHAKWLAIVALTLALSVRW